MQELEADIQELQRFVELSQRPRVKQLLLNNLSELSQRLSEARQAAPQPVSVSVVPPPPVESYTAISSYSWGQEGDWVNVYLDLDGVGSLPAGNIAVNFAPRGLEVRVHNLGGRNYKFAVLKLHSEIDPKASSYKVRPKSIVLLLKKKESRYWDSLLGRLDQKRDTDQGLDKMDDPTKSIMNLMRKMYEEGDDEMKRTIAKAWTEAQEKTAKGTF